jgi:glycosyltransferase involved in cell wall biosynthesis
MRAARGTVPWHMPEEDQDAQASGPRPDPDLGASSPFAPTTPASSHSALKVLLIDASDRGGIATYTAELRRALQREGVEVVLAAPEGLGDEGAVLAPRRWGPKVSQLGRLALYRLRLAELVPATLTVLRTVARVKPDVVHVQTDVVPGFDRAVLWVIARRRPVVVTAHDPVPHEGGEKEMADQAGRWRVADAVIIHAEEPRELVEARAGGTPVRVVPVDLRLAGPAPARRPEARARLGLPDRPTALLLGLLKPYKGIGLLAQAWPDVAAALPDARLLLVGEPYECPDLDTLERVPGVEVRRGFVAEEDLDTWAAAADVLVLPYQSGSHSGVLHRGLGAGTPVLASPSLREEVERTGAGRVVPLEPSLWSKNLIEVLGDHPLPPPPAPRGTRTATGTIAVYRDVVAARTARAATAPTPPATAPVTGP